jgi:acyl-CoA synthetase (AMP-forming)/AMP-acid ligase II
MEHFKNILTQGITISSSGTSGNPKQYFQSPEKIKRANEVAITAQKISKTSKIYTCCKVTHAGGLLAQTLPAVSIGAEVDVEPFSAYQFVKKIVNYTHSHITPLHARAIMMTKGFQTLDLSGVWITCGADPVHPDIIEAFLSKGCTFMVNWGMSEVGPIAINKVFTSVDQIQEIRKDKAAVLGDTFYCDWGIVDGELVVKGDICIYDGWYNTKDSVYLDDGVVYYTGRTNKDIDIWTPQKG